MLNHSIFGHNLIFTNNTNIKNFISSESIADIKFIKVDDFDIWQYGKVYEWSKLSGKEARVSISREAFANEGSHRWALEVRDRVKLGWEGDGNIVYYTYSCGVLELLFWILHTFLPLSLDYSHKMSIFHASGVDINGKSVIFLAPTHGGKSTLANAFVERGYKLIGDDSIGIISKDKNIYSVSSYPFRRPYRRVRELGIFTDRYLSGFQETGSIFILKRVNKDSVIEIDNISAIEAFEHLAKSLFVTYRTIPRDRMLLLSNILNQIPVYALKIPWNINRVSEVIEAVKLHTLS